MIKCLHSIIYSILIFFSTIPIISSETYDNLVKRNGLYYEKFSDTPFTGKIQGLWQGTIKNGKRNGIWHRYYEQGQLWWKCNFKDGLREGQCIDYFINGNISYRANYKNDILEGYVYFYNEDGTLDKDYSGYYENNKKVKN